MGARCWGACSLFCRHSSLSVDVHVLSGGPESGLLSPAVGSILRRPVCNLRFRAGAAPSCGRGSRPIRYFYLEYLPCFITECRCPRNLPAVERWGSEGKTLGAPDNFVHQRDRGFLVLE